MFTKIELVIRGGKTSSTDTYPNGILYIQLKYSYQHISGNNGYSVMIRSSDRGKTWKVQEW